MSKPKALSKSQEQTAYTDEEINELSEWLEELTLKQVFFLKDSYEAYLNQQAQACEAQHVH